MDIPKVLKLQDDEEFYVISSDGSDSLCLKSISGSLLKMPKSNIESSRFITEITNFTFDDLRKYIQFDEYYQMMLASDLSDDMLKKLKEIMLYHNEVIYGKTYEDPNCEMYDSDFQCITKYEHID